MKKRMFIRCRALHLAFVLVVTMPAQLINAQQSPAQTGALSKGYWQSGRGESLIAGDSSTRGVCNSTAWLRAYPPFQDLDAAAACSQVSSYAFNVIKAANASGASMNAMLKAQMLATALDVYFSDPQLGGNKISAPAPIVYGPET